MPNELREEMVEVTKDTVEATIESATSDGGFGKAAGIVGGVIIGAGALGYGVYKLAKFIKAKKSGESVGKHYTEVATRPTDDFEDEDGDLDK